MAKHKPGKKKTVKKKTSIGQGTHTRYGSPTRSVFPPAGGRKYRKRYRGQGRGR